MEDLRVRDITSHELILFGEIISKLERASEGIDVRSLIFKDMIKLMRADIGLSCIWDEKARKFVRPLIHNMEDNNFRRYETWYQFRDPHTFKLRALKRAARVEEVMPYTALYRTEFYNDFLRRDKLHHGVNIFLFDGHRDLGDFRLWRTQEKPDFEDREMCLLNALEPHIRKALIRNSNQNEQLTDREREIAMLVARGFRDRDIAQLLGISFSTVRTHVNRAMEKRGCANRAELAVSATKIASVQ
ncbi:LuxR family transcriptional regulator [Agrobacterium tumefaciens]|uniref:helix-turn-helix transcriptional regulator n=1 Tax=Agrobacterium tumefaciens TaxID=358 RepID=UPI0015722270|nr:LuxR family transcriptional regulator [Agrobacterium tumefaciens]NTB94902.1 LuxR family transcriptional regulator [Agrobacterium tumefaciens]NTC44023.1 LuxR family transcriptional regulator [Agrobacterium tumefaciens]